MKQRCHWLFAAVLIMLLCVACQAASTKPKTTKAPAKTPPAAWVTRELGEYTLDVPASWKVISESGQTAGWYTGKNEDDPDAIIVALAAEESKDLSSEVKIERESAVKVAGRAATKRAFLSNDKKYRGYIIAFTDPGEGGKFIYAAGASIDRWKEFEPTLNKIIASFRPPKPYVPSKAASKTRSLGEYTASIPEDWKEMREMGSEGTGWYAGSSENAPDAVFGLLNTEDHAAARLVFPDAKTEPTTLLGRTATKYIGKTRNNDFEGVIIVAEPDSSGKALVMMTGSGTGRWKQYESMLNDILASLKPKE